MYIKLQFFHICSGRVRKFLSPFYLSLSFTMSLTFSEEGKWRTISPYTQDRSNFPGNHVCVCGQLRRVRFMRLPLKQHSVIFVKPSPNVLWCLLYASTRRSRKKVQCVSCRQSMPDPIADDISFFVVTAHRQNFCRMDRKWMSGLKSSIPVAQQYLMADAI